MENNNTKTQAKVEIKHGSISCIQIYVLKDSLKNIIGVSLN